jgi:cytochrome c peroxidase
MFGGKSDPWEEAVARLRANPEYVKAFNAVFGHAPTRDAAAKAVATYERTVLLGNSLHDRAEAAMRNRVTEEESGKFVLKAEDYTAALKAEFATKGASLADLGLTEKDAAKADEFGKRLLNGRTLFFEKARCSNCHAGDTFTDHAFHNLGVGATKSGDLPIDEFGRFVRLPTGHKDQSLVGAFKTPGVRGLLRTAPYMHSGDEKTLEQVVDFYDRGGNVNAWLDEKMRDTAAESAYVKARAEGKPVDPAVRTYGPTKKPVIPLKLNLTAQEKADLVLFLKALNGDALDPLVSDPARFPTK